MKTARCVRLWVGGLAVALGLWSCAAPAKPPSPIEVLLSGLPDARYRATLVYARGQGASRPLAVILDPQGGATLSILPLSSPDVETDVLGELGRKDLIARIEGITGEEFGGSRIQYLERFSKWELRPIQRYGSPVGHLMSLDPRLRFEIRAGASGRVFSLVLRPSENFLREARGEE
ncbi:MAG: hypothetical protein HYY21_09335 [Candidatus Tectomicrobia bacterium]|nr:hypothetical protein [Candidatus Tectomicrobia bacterium]